MRKDIALVAVIVASLTLMVVPLNSTIIDILLAVNISLAVLLLMVAVYLKHPSDFSTFPSVILIGTAFRLSLSIGTTRLILSEAEAGDIIETFGEFVVSGSIAIGLVIFLIITVVQFIVVTKGAERVAEVGARFALDALPGKQMSIDAEARAGNITAEEAAERRARLDRESRFFGAMDGAMKFVKGDAIAGIIIICINLIGGVAVGMSAHGYGFGEAIGIFSLLTIGDGLVAQIPALLMSLCAGIIVTRAEGQKGKDLGSDISAEIIADPRVPAIGAPIVLGVGLIPGFPTITFAAMAVGMLLISAAIRRALRAQEKSEDAEAQAELDQQAAASEADNLALGFDDRIRLVIATDLADHLDLSKISQRLATHLTMLHAARGVRFLCPVIEAKRLSDPQGFQIEIDEVPVARETVPQDHVLLTGRVEENDDHPKWPLIDGIWIPRDQAEVISDSKQIECDLEVGISDLTFRIYEQNLGNLFSHGIFAGLMEEAREVEPVQMQKIDEELDDGSFYKMLRYLVEDGVPLRPLSLVVSSIRYWLTTLDDHQPVILAECLRGSMKRQLCHRIAGEDGVLGLALVEPGLEGKLRQGLHDQSNATLDLANCGLALDPETNDLFLSHVRRLMKTKGQQGRQIALVVSSDLRRRVRNQLASHNLHLPVLAAQEISSEIPSFPIELVGEEKAEAKHGNPTSMHLAAVS
ncbi:flagellar biosynthesis protein FlhA [Yoonia sp. 2307UL14-13]|uniref:flagellar biosynthesis protein FlhA n=1 Tax=Yoonia sp. 2307UL14-13 TaxID=3126506 RepID=UPI0030AF7F5D